MLVLQRLIESMDAQNLDAFIYPGWGNPPRLIGDLAQSGNTDLGMHFLQDPCANPMQRESLLFSASCASGQQGPAWSANLLASAAIKPQTRHGPEAQSPHGRATFFFVAICWHVVHALLLTWHQRSQVIGLGRSWQSPNPPCKHCFARQMQCSQSLRLKSSCLCHTA